MVNDHDNEYSPTRWHWPGADDSGAYLMCIVLLSGCMSGSGLDSFFLSLIHSIHSLFFIFLRMWKLDESFELKKWRSHIIAGCWTFETLEEKKLLNWNRNRQRRRRVQKQKKILLINCDKYSSVKSRSEKFDELGARWWS